MTLHFGNALCEQVCGVL